MPKIQLDTPAPDFALFDHRGKTISSSDFHGLKHVLLVFNRGFAGPFCRRHMAQLRQDYEKFKNQNTSILVVGPEDAASFERYWQDNNLPFIGLPDPERRVLMA